MGMVCRFVTHLPQPCSNTELELRKLAKSASGACLAPRCNASGGTGLMHVMM